MILNNKLLLRGEQTVIKNIEDELNGIIQKVVGPQSIFMKDNLYKRFRRLRIEEHGYEQDQRFIMISFTCNEKYIQDIIVTLQSYPIQVDYLSENEKHNVWIVSRREMMITQRFIPPWAIREIFKLYMDDTDSPIMLDGYQTILVDRNSGKLVIRDQTLTPDDLIRIFFTESINGRAVYEYLENYTVTYSQSCINNYEQLYVSSNKENWEGERTSPLALFIVTFGVFGIILFFVYLMGYI